MGLKPGTRLSVFSVRKDKRSGSHYWVKAGVGFVNRDESVNLWLDVLPIDGTLHCREMVIEKRESVVVPAGTPPDVAANLAMAPVEGHS